MAHAATNRERSFPPRVGRYQLLLPIASGGMATVYLGRVVSEFGFEREVAVKLLHPHLRSSEVERELVEEAKLAARVRHPHVVQTLDVGEDGGWVYLVMDYVEGDALSGMMKAARGGRGVRSAVAMRALVDALGGLHAAHELRDEAGAALGVVHRDVSPQNVLVGLDGVSRLADFGIAKTTVRLGHTATGVVKGKLAYMSPEQALGQRLDRRTDVWAAGVVAWEIAAERPLFGKRNDASVLLEIVSRDAPRLRSVAPNTPAALEEVVASALQRDPKKRMPTAEALAEALERACRGSALELAEVREVAEAVGLVSGARLSERREAVQQMLRLRSKMSELAERARHDELGFESHERTVRTPDVHDTMVATEWMEPMHEAHSAPARRRSGRVALFGAAALLSALALGWWASASLGDDERASDPTPVPVGAETPSATAAPSAPPVALPSAHASSAPPEPTPAQRPRPKRARPPRNDTQPVDSAAGPLKCNPYLDERCDQGPR